MAAEVHDRINVQNNPVNFIDPYGLETVLPAPVPLPIILPKTEAQREADRQLADWFRNHYNPNWPQDTLDLLWNDPIDYWFGPEDPTDPQQWLDWPQKRDEQIQCETGQPEPPPPGFDPDKPPKGPWWKRAGYAAARIIKLIHGWPQ